MSNELKEATTESDEKTNTPDIFLLKLELDINNWVTVAVSINTKAKDVITKVLKRPKIPKSTLCIVYNGASALDPSCNLYELMKLDPLGENIFIVLIPDDGTDEHKQAIYELFPNQLSASKPWKHLPTQHKATNLLFPLSNTKNQKKKQKKKLKHKYKSLQNRKTTKQFAKDLNNFVSADIFGLDAVVLDMKSNEESAKINFNNRVSKYQKRSDKRRGTITKLKRELNERNSSKSTHIKIQNKLDQNNSTHVKTKNKLVANNNNSTNTKMKNKYKKRDITIEQKVTHFNFNDEKTDSLNEIWLQHLNSIRQQLGNEIFYWNSVENEIKWPNISDKNNDKYIYERTLISQMQYWMRNCGMPAMRGQEDIRELKKQLLKMNEEADNLDEEVVQVTQQLFNMENEKNELQLQLNLLKQQMNQKKSGVFSLIQSQSLSPRGGMYNKPLPTSPKLGHSKSQTMTILESDELFDDHESDHITQLQRKLMELQESNISLKKEVIGFKIQKKVRKNK